MASPAIVSVQAHTASSFTVLIQEDGFSQSNPQIIQNDSVIWYNVDNQSNLTHRIVYDYDGDGLYNGTFDWDSGELSYDCERDENNTKLDENCTINFMVTLDMNWTVGNYSYQDIRSDGSIVNADVNASAAIDATKIHDGTISNTEFGYLNNVSSNIQTQIDSKTTLTAASNEATALAIALG